MDNTLDLLLKMDDVNLPEKDYEVKRLSEICGKPVIFKTRALPYTRASEISKAQKDDMEVHILLAGVVEPDLKSRALMEKHKAVTPAEVIKKILLPGEIVDISRAIEKLSGYRVDTIEEIKKK